MGVLWFGPLSLTWQFCDWGGTTPNLEGKYKFNPSIGVFTAVKAPQLRTLICGQVSVCQMKIHTGCRDDSNSGLSTNYGSEAVSEPVHACLPVVMVTVPVCQMQMFRELAGAPKHIIFNSICAISRNKEKQKWLGTADVKQVCTIWSPITDTYPQKTSGDKFIKRGGSSSS